MVKTAMAGCKGSGSNPETHAESEPAEISSVETETHTQFQITTYFNSGTSSNPVVSPVIESSIMNITGHKFNVQNYVQWAQSS